MSASGKQAPALDISALERACYSRAANRVDVILDHLNDLSFSEAGTPEIYARAAAAIAAVLSDTALDLAPHHVFQLLMFNSTITNLFVAGGLGGAHHLLRAIFPNGDYFSGSMSDGAKLLALWSPDFDGPFPVERLPTLEPRFALHALMNVTITTPPLTTHGERRREWLLERASQLAAAPITPTMNGLRLAGSAWMLCSYASAPDKHDIKKVLNRAFRTFHSQIKLTDAVLPERRVLRERPTLLMLAEVIQSRHVQFRYYGQYLRQLRERFRLVLMAPAEGIDDPVRPFFDEILTVKADKTGRHLTDMVSEIKRLAPDIIFWPSIGMQNWGPVIANLRLAPIQMTSVGHPASTYIEAMDYILLERGFVLDPALYTEKAILLPDEALRLERPTGYVPVPPQIREVADTVRIAIPSNLLKLNPTYVRVLQQIRKRARRPVEYHVFSNPAPLRHAAFRAAHAKVFTQDVLHKRMGPQRYLELMNACDMALSPFPFGGFHSVIDSVRQGLPTVAMDQPGHPFRTDWMIMRRLGMPDWLVARSPEEYVDAAVRIIDNDGLRVELSRQAVETRIDETLFGDSTTPLGSEVVDTVWALYRAHEAVQASSERAFDLVSLRRLSPD